MPRRDGSFKAELNMYIILIDIIIHVINYLSYYYIDNMPNKKKQSKWMIHVMKVYRSGKQKNKSYTLTDAMKAAKRTYKK
jgi:hypothetical protein